MVYFGEAAAYASAAVPLKLVRSLMKTERTIAVHAVNTLGNISKKNANDLLLRRTGDAVVRCLYATLLAHFLTSNNHARSAHE